MKKILSVLFILIILVFMGTNTAFATADDANISDSEFRFEYLLKNMQLTYYDYDEVYYHYTDENAPESEIDWAIVYVMTDPVPSGGSVIVADRVITKANIFDTYPVNWAIYDAQLQKIISIEQADPSKYDDFEVGLEEAKIGYPFGDADRDATLSVMDATYIQRVLANLSEFSQGDVIACGFWGVSFSEPHYISDIDGDGERTILDATAIQMKLAKK